MANERLTMGRPPTNEAAEGDSASQIGHK
jgi:hypothetical protein